MNTDTTMLTPAAAGSTTINFHDWDRSRMATIEIPTDVSVAEAVEEARIELDLPSDVAYYALHRDRQLPGLSTLRDAGIETDADVDLMPDVRAGAQEPVEENLPSPCTPLARDLGVARSCVSSRLARPSRSLTSHAIAAPGSVRLPSTGS